MKKFTLTKKQLEIIKMGATALGLIAQVIGAVAGSKKESIEMREAVKELVDQTTQKGA